MMLAHRALAKRLPTTLTDLLHPLSLGLLLRRARDLLPLLRALALRSHLQVKVLLLHRLDADHPLTIAMEALQAAAGVVTVLPTAEISVHPTTVGVDAVAAHLLPLQGGSAPSEAPSVANPALTDST